MLSKATLDHIDALVADWPPLSPETRDKIAAIFRSVEQPEPPKKLTKFEAEIERLAEGIANV